MEAAESVVTGARPGRISLLEKWLRCCLGAGPLPSFGTRRCVQHGELSERVRLRRSNLFQELRRGHPVSADCSDPVLLAVVNCGVANRPRVRQQPLGRVETE